MAKVNISNLSLNADTLKGRNGDYFARFENDTYGKGFDLNTIWRVLGYAYNSTSHNGQNFPTTGPMVGFGNPGVYKLFQGVAGSSDLYFGGANGNAPLNWRQFAFQDWVSSNFVSKTSQASLVSLEDLKDILTDEQIAKIEAKVLRRVELINSEDMINNNVVEHNGGGVFRNLTFMLGDYAVSVRQKGGQRNGQDKHSGHRGAEGLQRPMVKEFRSGRLLQDDIRAFGNGFQQPSRIGSILYSRRCRGKRMHRVAFRECRNSVQFLWSDRKKRPDLYSLSRRSNVCEGVRSQHKLTLEASQYDLALRKEVVA